MKKLQEGRSMIEMLGVLAIIGVLSIGGLAGYTMAMNRYRANTLTDYVMRCGVVSQTNGMGTDATTGDCNGTTLLNEKAPGFLGTGGKCSVQKYTGGKALEQQLCEGVVCKLHDILLLHGGHTLVAAILE